MKKTIAIILSLVLALAILAACAPAPAVEEPAAEAPATEAATEAPAAEAPAADSDKVINIYTFTDEVPKMLEKYIAAHPDFGYTINATIIPPPMVSTSPLLTRLWPPAVRMPPTCTAQNPHSF